MNIEKSIDLLKESTKYTFPYIVIPIIAIYGLESIRVLSYIIQLGLIVFTTLSVSAFIFGIVLGIFSDLPGQESGWHVIAKTRLVKIFKPISWGRDLAKWLMDEPQSDSSGSK